jgi:hypothetical protein
MTEKYFMLQLYIYNSCSYGLGKSMRVCKTHITRVWQQLQYSFTELFIGFKKLWRWKSIDACPKIELS